MLCRSWCGYELRDRGEAGEAGEGGGGTCRVQILTPARLRLRRHTDSANLKKTKCMLNTKYCNTLELFFRYCLLHHVGQVQTCLNLVWLEVTSNQLPEAWRMKNKTRQDLEVHSHLNMENRLGGGIGSDEVWRYERCSPTCLKWVANRIPARQEMLRVLVWSGQHQLVITSQQLLFSTWWILDRICSDQIKS